MARYNTKSDDIIIKTRRPFYAVIDMYKDPEMAKLKDAESAGILPEQKNPTVQSKAGLFQKPGMLIEYYMDDEDGERKNRFKDSVILAEADQEGRIYLPKEERDLAKRIIKALWRIDKEVDVDSSSALSLEEIMGPTPEKRMPGRPPKTQGKYLK